MTAMMRRSSKAVLVVAQIRIYEVKKPLDETYCKGMYCTQKESLYSAGICAYVSLVIFNQYYACKLIIGF